MFHKSTVSWKPFDVIKKELVTRIEKILDLLFISWDYCFYSAYCNILKAFWYELKNIYIYRSLSVNLESIHLRRLSFTEMTVNHRG